MTKRSGRARKTLRSDSILAFTLEPFECPTALSPLMRLGVLRVSKGSIEGEVEDVPRITAYAGHCSN